MFSVGTEVVKELLGEPLTDLQVSRLCDVGYWLRVPKAELAAWEDKLRAKRWADFRRRVEHAPASVYRHRTRGWEYIPVHPFADEPAELARLGLRPEDCGGVDAWWGIDGDATL